MKKEIFYYFDFLSPFSYFSWQFVRQLLDNKDLTVHIKPVSLGKLLNQWELKGPGEITPKREFLLRQCLRYGIKNKIPFTTPKTHPFNPLYALRLSLKEIAGEQQVEIIDCLWKHGWVNGEDLGDPESIIQALNQAGFAGHELVEKSSSSEARKAFKANIDEAIGYGAFGVPSFVYNGELFWGNDCREDFINCLENRDPLDWEHYQHLIDKTPRAAVQRL